MSHPVLELSAAAAVVLVVGAGAILALPRQKPEPPAQTIVLGVEAPPVVRVEPQAVKSNAERVDDLQRQLGAIAAEQKQLSGDLRAALASKKSREGRSR